jgi:hypothetical protein
MNTQTYAARWYEVYPNKGQNLMQSTYTRIIYMKSLFRLKLWDKVKVKVKVKLSLCLTKHHTIKTFRGNGGIAPYILDLGTRWR